MLRIDSTHSPSFFSPNDLIDEKNLDTHPTAAISKNTDVDQQEHDLRNELIKRIALVCLSELTAALMLLGMVYPFVPKNSPRYVADNISMLALSTIFHSMQSLISYEFQSSNIFGLDHHAMNSFLLKFISGSCATMRFLLFSLIDEATHGVLIHETGHALAGILLCKLEKWPEIVIFPASISGRTDFSIIDLTRLGNWLGEGRSLAILAGAGPAFAIFDATALLCLAHAIKDTQPEMYFYLITMAITRMYGQVGYALSALSIPSFTTSWEGNNDFYFLWKEAKIHPVVAAITMIAVPLLVQGTLMLYQHTFRKVNDVE